MSAGLNIHLFHLVFARFGLETYTKSSGASPKAYLAISFRFWAVQKEK